ncbi:hypothetical protein GDO81_024353 [Engystomops pustulosus]|uniref:Uncharacterized protein n=1 Tax=Engystomops pustulosus TaxID=76066 RepID=A0AAV6YRN8_ENGPU|nr:hypothetical protein GDO81_024353 [Engystomops pustulosus]
MSMMMSEEGVDLSRIDVDVRTLLAAVTSRPDTCVRFLLSQPLQNICKGISSPSRKLWHESHPYSPKSSLSGCILGNQQGLRRRGGSAWTICCHAANLQDSS